MIIQSIENNIDRTHSDKLEIDNDREVLANLKQYLNILRPKKVSNNVYYDISFHQLRFLFSID